MKIKIPQALKAEHDELHAMLKQSILLFGKTGKVAEKVAQLLHPHFLREEKYALPQLGLLPALAEGNVAPEMSEAIDLSAQLKKNLQEMLSEHQRIVAALNELIKAAAEEQYPDVVDFAEKLMRHAQMEEEILYPAAIVIGEYLKLKLQQDVKATEYYP